MRQNRIIQRIIASFLLLLFAAATAPKAYFHDLVADHKDVASCDQLHKTSVLHKRAYNCHCEDLVVSSPFVMQPASETVPPRLYLQKEVFSFYVSSHQLFVQHKENRGPPAA